MAERASSSLEEALKKSAEVVFVAILWCVGIDDVNHLVAAAGEDGDVVCVGEFLPEALGPGRQATPVEHR